MKLVLLVSEAAGWPDDRLPGFGRGPMPGWRWQARPGMNSRFRAFSPELPAPPIEAQGRQEK